MSKENTNSKHTLVYVIVIIIIIFMVILGISKKQNSYSVIEQKDKLTISYKNKKNLNYTNFNKHFKDKQVIKIENKSEDVKVINLKWKNVKNTLKYQDKFLYEISCEGNNCNGYYITSSQVPVSEFVLFSDIYLDVSQIQTYTINFTYNGKTDNKGYLKGNLVIEEGIINKKKYDEYIKQRQSKINDHRQIVDEYQKLDDK